MLKLDLYRLFHDSLLPATPEFEVQVVELIEKYQSSYHDLYVINCIVCKLLRKYKYICRRMLIHLSRFEQLGQLIIKSFLHS